MMRPHYAVVQAARLHRSVAVQAAACTHDGSRGLARQVFHRGLGCRATAARVLLVDLVQPDAGNVLPNRDARADEQIVEMLLDDAAQQVLAEIGHLGVLVESDAAGLSTLALIASSRTEKCCAGRSLHRQTRFPANAVRFLHAQRPRVRP